MTDWILKYQAIIAVLIAVLGWLAQYFYSVKAQKKNLLNQINNEARKAITKDLKEYQDWLDQIGPLIPQGNLIIEGVYSDWISFSKKILGVSNNSRLEWIFTLEEYEILFPETRNVREELAVRHHKIFTCINDSFKLALTTNEDDRKKAILIIEEQNDYVFDQIALIEDLKIYIQNITLNILTGNMVPARQPLDPLVPLIIKDKKGQLQIKEG